jgi:hypothetical protein
MSGKVKGMWTGGGSGSLAVLFCLNGEKGENLKLYLKFYRFSECFSPVLKKTGCESFKVKEI